MRKRFYELLSQTMYFLDLNQLLMSVFKSKSTFFTINITPDKNFSLKNFVYSNIYLYLCKQKII